MTDLLRQAFEKASALSDDLQNQLARQILEEMEAELRWDETLANTQDKLDWLAEKAEREFRAGRTKPLGFDDL